MDTPIRRQITSLEAQVLSLREALVTLPADQRALPAADLARIQAALARSRCRGRAGRASAPPRRGRGGAVMAPLSGPPSADGANQGRLVLRLYIAGAAPNSLRAVDNLKVMCEAHFPGRCSLEIVDVLEQPLRALSDDILVTPTLVKLSPGVKTRVIGDLSDERKVLSALGAGAER